MLAIASPSNHAWLVAHGATPVPYGGGLADRLPSSRADRVGALIDLFGPDYLDLAVELGIAPDRIETVIAYA